MRRLLPTLLLSTTTLLYCSTSSLAADYQQCTVSTTCTIGEFLYNDEYLPLTGATCTLTSKYPDNSSYLNSVAMTGAADGWYSYDASIGTTTGLYHSSICCTAGSDYLCIDKSFEVKDSVSSSITAADIWNYSDRTLTGYGTLVSDIWNASSRSLTSFGSLVSDVWNFSGRTMTSFGSLVENIWGATPSTLTATNSESSLSSVLSEQQKQREMLEKLVNAPIITLELEDNQSQDLSLKLESSKAHASELYDALQSSKSRLLSLDEKWPRLNPDAITKELTQLSQIWTEPDSLSALTKEWNTSQIEELNSLSAGVKTSLSTLIAIAATTKSTTPPSNLFSIIESLSDIETILGDVTSDSSDATFFGYLSSVAEKDTLLENESSKLSNILESWDTSGESILKRQVKDSQDRLLAINEYPGGDTVIEPSNKQAKGKSALKNLVFSLQGLIGLNRSLLASSANTPVRGLWLEEGSIIFRAVITNPSKLVSQSVPLKFYLPREIKNEDIISIDDSLIANYDTIEELIAVTGTYELKPGATRIVAVEVNDVWQLSHDELITLKTKANDLLKPLEKSNFLSQAITLKSQIETTLDELMRFEAKGVKPENRIRAYREAQLKLVSARSNLTQMENLVAESSSKNSLIGYVGGVGTTAVFGIVLVVVAGFIFMSTYFKKFAFSMPDSPIQNSDPSLLSTGSSDFTASSEPRLTPLITSPIASGTPKWQMPAIIALVMVVTAGGTVWLTRLAKPQPMADPPNAGNAPAEINQVVPATSSHPDDSPATSAKPDSSPTPSPRSEAKTPSVVEDEVGKQLTHSLVVPEDSSVNVRNNPSAEADIIMSIKETQDVYLFEEDGDWSHIGFSETDQTKGYWVNSKFIEEK